MTDTTARLAKLRSLMQERNVQIYVVPSEDSHNSEYIAACDARRAFISGFTGSAGCAIVTDEVAAVSTDGRYFNQASKELDDNWTLLKQGMQDVPTWQEWAAEQSAGGKNVAVDPTLLPGPAAKKLQEQIRKAGGAELRPLDENLADIVWGSERPARSLEPVSVLPDKLAGKTVEAKLTELRQEMEKKNCPGFFVSMLDEIAWLFNLRGKDIPYNPVFFSYASVTPDSATLYIDQRKVDQDSLAHLTANNVRVKPYDEFFKDAEQLHAEVSAKNQEAKDGKNAKFLTSKTASWALNKALGGEDMVDEIRSPIADAKTVKNEVEMEGMRACHIRDAVALIEYFAWLEDQLLTQKATVDEAQGADKLEELRSTRENFVGLSFNTISSTGANAAIIHYGPEHGNCSSIDPAAPYLCDSGGQYLDGTTDTTRTMHFGTPNAAEIEAYTLVLKGLIALHMIVFPKGTNGYAIDCLARQHLWKNGLDFRHGTGHGVGSYLNVHEGPIGIGTRLPYTEVALAPGNVLSNEPGFYEDGKYGVRIENMMMVVEVKPKHTWGDKPFYGFENVTMVPYCRKLIDTTMLSKEEKGWLNASNVEILEKIKGHLENNALATAWLERETQPYE